LPKRADIRELHQPFEQSDIEKVETQSSERQGRDFDRRSQDLGLYALSPVRARHQSRLAEAVRKKRLVFFFVFMALFPLRASRSHHTDFVPACST
jgi:hypothetical protein